VKNTQKNINILDCASDKQLLKSILIEYDLKYFNEYFGNNKNQIKLLHKNMKIF
jgi:hypothetical protein